MRYLFCFFVVCFQLFSEEEDFQENPIVSTPEQISILTSEPSYLVGGLVNPLSGQPVLRQRDLVVKGAQNISLDRCYIPLYMPCELHHETKNKQEYDKKYLS